MASESGCPIEFHRIDVDKCDPVFDKECQGNKYIPFLRADYDRQTGRSPNSPREQVIRNFREHRSTLPQITSVESASGIRWQYSERLNADHTLYFHTYMRVRKDRAI